MHLLTTLKLALYASCIKMGTSSRSAVHFFVLKLQSRISRSDLTKPHIEALAPLYPQTKFVSIVGDKCIPNLPDSRIPMIIVYKSGEIVEQLTAWKGGQLHGTRV